MDRPVLTEYDSFLQTPFWAEVKRAEGWRPYFFEEEGERILLLVRTLYRGAAVGYVPYGWNHSPVTSEKAYRLSRQWKKETGEPLFLDEEVREIVDSLRTRPEMKILFSASKKATKEDILKTVKIIEALRNGENE